MVGGCSLFFFFFFFQIRRKKSAASNFRCTKIVDSEAKVAVVALKGSGGVVESESRLRVWRSNCAVTTNDSSSLTLLFFFFLKGCAEKV
ncbi:hypothetical protein ABFS83_13G031200 [Erythranthe nasuta]